MSTTNGTNAIVLWIDGLGVNHLAAYGNTLFESENFNRLASQSIVFEQALTPQPACVAAMRHAIAESGLLQELLHAGVESSLLSQQPDLEQLEWTTSLDSLQSLAVRPSTAPSEHVDTTELAQCFAQLAQAISELPTNAVLHCQLSGFLGAWDAPPELRQQLADPDDPPPPDLHRPPVGQFDPQGDPDELLQLQQVVAAQMWMLDHFLGGLLELLEQPEFDQTLLCLTSPRGYPLGEHGPIGWPADEDRPRVHGESLHVPLMVRFPQSLRGHWLAARSHALVHPAVIAEPLAAYLLGDSPRLSAWLDRYVDQLASREREWLALSSSHWGVFQTHAWKLIRTKQEQDPLGERLELYVKPDDRWEVNDVARRCPGVVMQLVELLDSFEARQLEPGALPESGLPEALE